MSEWPKHLKIEDQDTVGSHYSNGEYMVMNGGWRFTAEKIGGRYYLMAVDGFTRGHICDRLIGLELLPEPRRKEQKDD